MLITNISFPLLIKKLLQDAGDDIIFYLVCIDSYRLKEYGFGSVF